MASSIGSEQFYLLTGRVNPLTQRVEEITRENVDGEAFRLEGKRSQPTQHQTEADVATEAAGKAKESSYAALVGTMQTLTYDDGQQLTNVMVLGVQVSRVRKVETPVGGVNPNGPWVVEATWQLQATE